MSGIVLGQTPVTKENYNDYVKALHDAATQSQPITQQALAPLQNFMKTDGLDLPPEKQAAISGDMTLLSMGQYAASISGSSTAGNNAWTSAINQLLTSNSSPSAASFSASYDAQGVGHLSGIPVVSGTSTSANGQATVPAGTALSAALAAPGAAVTYNADNDLFTVSAPSGGVRLYAADGADLGAVPATGESVNITNPKVPGLGFVTIGADGSMSNGDSASSSAALTLTGTGGGHYNPA